LLDLNRRKQLKTEAAINYKKRQQITWFGYVIRQNELNITQRVINKKFENARPSGRLRKQWIGGILEALGNITAEEANRKAKNRNLSLPSTLRGNLRRRKRRIRGGGEEKEEEEEEEKEEEKEKEEKKKQKK
jgi:hypothetical protein